MYLIFKISFTEMKDVEIAYNLVNYGKWWLYKSTTTKAAIKFDKNTYKLSDLRVVDFGHP